MVQPVIVDFQKAAFFAKFEGFVLLSEAGFEFDEGLAVTRFVFENRQACEFGGFTVGFQLLAPSFDVGRVLFVFGVRGADDVIHAAQGIRTISRPHQGQCGDCRLQACMKGTAAMRIVKTALARAGLHALTAVLGLNEFAWAIGMMR